MQGSEQLRDCLKTTNVDAVLDWWVWLSLSLQPWLENLMLDLPLSMKILGFAFKKQKCTQIKVSTCVFTSWLHLK